MFNLILFLTLLVERSAPLYPEVNYKEQEKWRGHCNRGHLQSPINVREQDSIPTTDHLFTSINFNVLNNFKITNKAYTLTAEPITSDKDRPGLTGGPLSSTIAKLNYFEFHFPSEHQLEGVSYPLELQFVFEATDKQDTTIEMTEKFLVFAIFYDYNLEYPEKMNKLTEVIVELDEPGKSAYVEIVLDDYLPLMKYIPYYAYEGSLTTPPCEEIVMWILPKMVASLTNEDIEFFKNYFASEELKIKMGPNNRSIQNYTRRRHRVKLVKNGANMLFLFNLVFFASLAFQVIYVVLLLVM